MKTKNYKKRTALLKTLVYIKKHIFLVVLSFLCALISVALTLYAPILVGRAIDSMTGVGLVDFSAVSGIAIELLIVTVFAAALQWLMGAINNRIAFLTVRDIRNSAFRRLQRLPMSFADSSSQGDIVSRIISDADQFSEGLLLGFSQLFTGVITIIGTLIFMISINGWVAIAVLLLTPVSFIIANFVAKRTYSLFRKQSELRGEQTGFINESVTNLKVGKAFSMEQNNIERFGEINSRLTSCSLKATFFSSLVNPSTRFVNSLVYAVVLLMGAFLTVSGSMTVGGITSFLSYSGQFAKPFNEISGVITELQNALACADRLFGLIELEPEKSDALPEKALENVKGNVNFDNVGFSYTADKPLIKNLNLSVEKGSRVAVVGPTGCGKTTLINLLMRFYDVNTGKITVDGEDINSVTRKSLRKSFGMVLQDTWIKTGTVRENIAFANPDASLDDIIAAAKRTHAHSFIKRLPQGYDTVISNDSGLSAGQKQLLCITRVMLNIPPMLILDEATSSIDTRTEQKISDAFAVLMKGRTGFIVAHRLSTIKNADIILVMRDGNIIEQGTHNQLLAQKGFYYNLYSSQFED